MSVQPFASSVVSTEAAAPRPRPVERDRQAFTVPDQPPPAEPASQPDKSAASAKDDKAAAPAKDDKTPAAKDQASQTKDGTTAAPAGTDSAVSATTSGSAPVQPTAPEAPEKPVPAVATPAPLLDIGALVAIAVASASPNQVKGEADAKGETTAADETKSESEGGDATPVATTAGVDVIAAAVVPDPAAPTPVLAPIVPLPTPGGDSKTVQAEAAAPEVAISAVALAAGPVASAKVAVARLPATKAGDASPDDASASASVETGDGKVKAGASAETAIAATAVKDGGPDSAAPAAGAPDAKDFKPLEALQLGQAAIDLSALAQHRPARHDIGAAISATPEQAAQQQGATAPGQAASGQPTPLHVVPVEIGMKALAGMKQFEIRLDPAELGRVDVKLDISDKGEVSARLVVDRVETLHLLQRDARTLERAFEQAGLKSSDAGVEISLRDQPDQSAFRQQQRQQDGAPGRGRTGARDGDGGSDDIAIAAQSTTVRRVRLGGVDLSV